MPGVTAGGLSAAFDEHAMTTVPARLAAIILQGFTIDIPVVDESTYAHSRSTGGVNE